MDFVADASHLSDEASSPEIMRERLITQRTLLREREREDDE